LERVLCIANSLNSNLLVSKGRYFYSEVKFLNSKLQVRKFDYYRSELKQ
jgi:hypothetical protein